jgi:hypothetical protein
LITLRRIISSGTEMATMAIMNASAVPIGMPFSTSACTIGMVPAAFARSETVGAPLANGQDAVQVLLIVASTSYPERPPIVTGFGSVVVSPGRDATHPAIDLASEPMPGSGLAVHAGSCIAARASLNR